MVVIFIQAILYKTTQKYRVELNVMFSLRYCDIHVSN